jgi:hypothetical protein
MKIKVDKEEYERLLERVYCLEEEFRHSHDYMYKNWKWTRESLYEMMEDYFKTQCMTVMVKRDKNIIVGEVRENAMNNLFKENKK